VPIRPEQFDAGRRADDLPGFTSDELLLFRDWLEFQRGRFVSGCDRCRAAYKASRSEIMRNNARYYQDADRAARWLAAQLDYTIAARRRAEGVTDDGTGGDAG
jgi:hypothetical protein